MVENVVLSADENFPGTKYITGIFQRGDNDGQRVQRLAISNPLTNLQV